MYILDIIENSVSRINIKLPVFKPIEHKYQI